MSLVATPNERETLDEIERMKAAGKDPFGDDELDNVKVIDEVQDEPDVDPENPDADPVTTETPETAASEPEPEVQEAPVQAQYQAEVPADYKDQRALLLKEKAQAMKQLMDGELEPDAFAEIEARVSNQLEDLTAQRIRAETLLEANVQTQRSIQQNEINKLISRSKSELDYMATPQAQKQFDMALSMIQADPDNAGKDFADQVAEAHRAVLAIRGVPSKSQQVANAVAKAAEDRKPQGKPPVTLRNLPAASTPNANGGVIEQMARLSGQAYEDAFAKLSPQQRKSLLDEE